MHRAQFSTYRCRRSPILRYVVLHVAAGRMRQVAGCVPSAPQGSIVLDLHTTNVLFASLDLFNLTTINSTICLKRYCMPVQVASMATKHLFVADAAWLYNAPKLWLFNLKNWSCRSSSFQPYRCTSRSRTERRTAAL